ncbi:autotransporter-associated beta strand repeat-containing protein [Verrucomicrobium sp. BvORR034]|uniref:autotransporter-associated beta strand repeat-containing protein n=1 Tax=Verrucomicrobium sp. BvORR034 TaxID=1396418 RepID=UPI000A533CC0|nr:autotransporter-associated beta strand repeat-containing protein [Verrucomicrobium sp. BvORR034]
MSFRPLQSLLLIAAIQACPLPSMFGQERYFDATNAAGLNGPTPSTTVVPWNSNVWQGTDSPGTAAPSGWVDGSTVFFQTPDVNRLDVAGTVVINELYQTLGNGTYIGGSGTLEIQGGYIANYSSGVLHFAKGLTLDLNPEALDSTDQTWDTATGDIVVDAVLSGNLPGNMLFGGGLLKMGTNTLYLNNANTYTGATTVSEGWIHLGNTRGLGLSNVTLAGGGIRYGSGITVDLSTRITEIAGSGGIIDTNGNNITFKKSLVGSGVLTKTGEGRLTLRASAGDVSFGGSIIVEQGVLALAAGTGFTNNFIPTGGIVVNDGATLDISGLVDTVATVTAPITLTGRGVDNLGALVKNSSADWDPGFSGLTLTGHTTIGTFGNRLDIDGTSEANGYSITKIGSGSFQMDSSFNNLGNVYVKQAEVGFHGGSSFGNNTGALVINSGAGVSSWERGADGDKGITLNGGYISRTGRNTAATSVGRLLTARGGLNLASGHSEFRNNIGAYNYVVYQLNTINRQIGATLNVQDTSMLSTSGTVGGTPQLGNPTLVTTSTTNTNGIIGGYFIYGNNTWAVNATNAANGTVTGLTTFETSLDPTAWADATPKNVSLNGNATTSIASDLTINSLRLTAASTVNIDASRTLTLHTGGLLVTGSGATTIGGAGTLRGAAGQDLVIHQNSSQTLTISAIIANNGGATALTKTGDGMLVLSGTNTYTGNTYINGRAGGGSSTGQAILSVTSLATSGFDNLGSTGNQIYFNNGVLRYANTTTDATTSRTVNLLSGGGTFDVQTSGRILTLSGKITGEALASDEGFYFGQGNLNKVGSGTLVLTSGDNDYTGSTIVSAGTLRLAGAGKLGGRNGYYSQVMMSAGAILELNGTSQTVGLLSGAGGSIRNSGAGTSVLTIGADNVSSSSPLWGVGVGFAGVLEDGTSGKLSVVKTGTGLQILSGNNTYTGATDVTRGTLQVGNGTGASSAAVAGAGGTTVRAGATLSGNGTVGSATSLTHVQSGGILSVGTFEQTAAQILAINGSFLNDGIISLDVWGEGLSDRLKFNTDASIDLNGSLILNNQSTFTAWELGDSLQLIDWGTVSLANRHVNFSNIDLGSLGILGDGLIWDFGRFQSTGVIRIMEDVLAGALRWDANTGTSGAQDGSGVWTTDNHWWNPTTAANVAFVNGSSVIFGSGSGAAGTVSVAASGVTVNHITFQNAGSGTYTIDGPGAITLSANSWITANTDATISASMVGIGGFTKAGAGTLTVLGNNTFTGNVTLFSGVLEVGSTRGLGMGGAGSIVFDGGTLRHAMGITNDFSSRFGAIGAGGAVVDTNGQNLSYATGFTGSGTFTKTGDGRLLLTSTTNTFAGQIIVDQGILAIGSRSVFGTSTNFTNGVVVRSGATLDLSPVVDADLTSNTQERIELYGRGVDGLGSLVLNTGTNWFTGAPQFLYLRDNVTIGKSAGGRLNVNGDAGGFAITLVGNGHFTTDGFNNMGSVYVKAGQYMMQSPNFGSANTSAVINSGAYMSFWQRSSIIGKRVVLNGGALLRTGTVDVKSAENMYLDMTGGLVLGAGNSEIRHSASHMIFQLNEINRSTGGTLNVQDTSGLTGNNTPAMVTTTTANTNGIIGGYLTYGKNTWAVNSGATAVGSKTNVITGLATADYASAFTAAGNNVDVTTSNQTPGAGFTVNSLRFNQAAAVTLSLSGINTLQSGGILVTSTVGNNAVNINGGTLVGSAGTGGDLVIHQNNTTNILTINSIIANNGASATGLTKSGAGALVLGSTNTYTGNTYINGDAGGGGVGEVRVSSLATSGNDNLGSASNALYLNNGRLRYTNSSSNAETSRAIHLLSGGGRFQVDAANVTLTLSGKITGEALASDEGWYWGQGTLFKDGAGTLVITNGTNDYTGGTTITAGTLRLSGAGKLGASQGYLSVTNGILDLGGTSQTVGLLLSSSTGGIIQNSGTGVSVLTVGSGNASSGANGSTYGSGSGYQGIIRDNAGTGTGTVALVKVGTGLQILTGASTYTGTTQIQQGILQIGAGTAATSTARTGSGLHTVSSGGTLSGNGIIGGHTVVNAGGLISVGTFGQTGAQSLTFNAGLTNQGTIALDVWGATSVDQIKFLGNAEVNLGGSLVLNNGGAMASYGWQVEEALTLIDWGGIWMENRHLDYLSLDMALLGLADGANTYWDLSRLGVDGTIVVRSNDLIWDANTSTAGAQDGAGTWTADNHWVSGGSNVTFASNGNENVIFGTGTGNGANVQINNPGGITVRDITFKSGTGTGAAKYYEISGAAGAPGVLNLAAGSWVKTDHAYEADFGSTISAVIAGTNWSKAGSGRLILSGANTFTGNLSVLQGVLDIRNAQALGTTAGNTQVTGGATLEVRGGITVAENLVLNGNGYSIGVDPIGVLRNNSGNNTFSGTISLASNSQVTSRAGTLTLSGVISGAGALIITGEDTTSIVQLTGGSANTFTGGVTVKSGELRLGKNAGVNAIAANSRIQIGTGGSRAVLRLAQSNQIADSGTVLSFAGTGSSAGVFQLMGLSETVGAIESTGGAGIIENGSGTAGSLSTLTVNHTTDHVFSGIMRNGSQGWLAFVKGGSGKLTLTGDNSYNSTTVVRGGVLELAGSGGRISGTSGITVAEGSVLRLTNASGAAQGDRLNDAATVLMSGGTLDFNHDGAGNYSETVGTVQITAGSNVISSSQAVSGRTSTLMLSSLQRLDGGLLEFSGTGLGVDNRNQIFVGNFSEDMLDHGMLAAWMTVGDNFAKYGDNGVVSFDDGDYHTGGESGWTFDKNVKTTASQTLTADRNINSLNVAQSGAGQTLNLGGHALRVESGGIIVSGDYNSAIANGSLTAGTGTQQGGELIIYQNSSQAFTLEISANITDNGTQAVGVTKSGEGNLVLSGQNTFTGGLAVHEGKVTLATGAALAAGNDLLVNAGRFDFNGQNLVLGRLGSDANATTGVVENLGAAASLTIGEGNASSNFYGSLRGAVTVTKTGTGTMTLGGNNTYTGQTIVEQGILRIGNANALGALGNAGNGTIVHDGATLDVSDMPRLGAAYAEYITISGHGVDGLGVITKNSAEEWNYGFGYLFLDGDVTLNSSGGRFDVETGGSDARGHSITKIGTSGLTFDGTMANLGNLYAKQSSIQFAGSADMGYFNDASGHNFIYVLTNTGLNFWDKTSDSKGVVLRGGSINRNGSSAGSVNGNTFDIAGGLYLEAGNSELRSSNSALVFALNGVNRSVGATLNVVSTSSALATTTSVNVNGILGGYATYGGNTWAVGSTNGSVTNITGLSTYETSTTATNWAAEENVSLGASASGVGTQTINSLRLTAAATVTIGTGNTLTLNTGGLLVTGAGATKITGGTLVGAAGKDLVIIQNASAALTIESIIANNGGATALTKSGTGSLILTGNNTYTGGTYIHGQAGGGSRGVISVSKISDTGDSNLGNSTGGSNGLYLNNGLLEYTGGTTATTTRAVQLLSGGGEFRITAAGASLELNGVVSGEALNEDEGFYAGQGNLVKSGEGTLVLGGTQANTYTGDTTINAGALHLNKTTSTEGSPVHAINGNVILNNNSILMLKASHQIKDTSVITLNGTSVFRLNGQSETIGGLVGTATGTLIEDGSGMDASLTVNVANGKTYSYAGSISESGSMLKFIKEGAGTQVLVRGLSTVGGLDVNEGILQVGDGQTSAGLGNGNISIAENAELVVKTIADIEVMQDVSGEGTFTQAGSGTTTLSGASFSASAVNVQAGHLVVNSFAVSAPVVNVTGGTLGGYGTITGNVVVKGSGQISQRDHSGFSEGLGTLTIDGNLVLTRPEASAMPRVVLGTTSYGATYHDAGLATWINTHGANTAGYFSLAGNENLISTSYDVNAAGNHGQLIVNGELTLEAGAQILFENLNGYEFQIGDVFNLIDWGTLNLVASGSDRVWSTDWDLLLPTLSDANMRWDTSLFGEHGVVFVSAPEPGRFCLLFLALGSVIFRRRRSARVKISV